MTKSGAEILQEAFDRLAEAGPPVRGAPPIHTAEPGYVVDCLRVPPQRTAEEDVAAQCQAKAHSAYAAYQVLTWNGSNWRTLPSLLPPPAVSAGESGAEEQILRWRRQSLFPLEIRDHIEEIVASALRPEIQIKLVQELLARWQATACRLCGVREFEHCERNNFVAPECQRPAKVGETGCLGPSPHDWLHTVRFSNVGVGDPDGPLVGLPQPAPIEERPFTPNKFGEHD